MASPARLPRGPAPGDGAPRGPAPGDGAPLIIVSHNTAGGTLVVSEIIRTYKPHILCLQEVKVETKELNALVNRQHYNAESNLDPTDITKPGTAIVWRNNIVLDEAPITVEPRRIQVIQLAGLSVFNVYAPSGSGHRAEREHLFSGELARNLRMKAGEQVVIMGDWNCVLSPEDVERDFQIKNSPALEQIVQDNRLSDAFKHLHPSKTEFTFHRASVSRSRLDRLYLSYPLRPTIASVTHEPGLGDH